MWTPAARAQLARGAIPYATCLADAEWALVRPFMPAPGQTGRPRRWPMRRILDGILYVLRTGCAWAHLPRDLPPPGTVHRWFLRLARSGTFERLAHAVAMADRERVSREASPTAAVLDAQSARSGGVGVAGARGLNAAKRVVGRKRHALVDTDGRLLMVAVSPRRPDAALSGDLRPSPRSRLLPASAAPAGSPPPRAAGRSAASAKGHRSLITLRKPLNTHAAHVRAAGMPWQQPQPGRSPRPFIIGTVTGIRLAGTQASQPDR